jgi:hypothetical protein
VVTSPPGLPGKQWAAPGGVNRMIVRQSVAQHGSVMLVQGVVRT